MKKYLVAALAFAAISSMPAHAISAKHRQALEWSGCNMVTESNGTCDITKPKAQNAKRPVPLKQLSAEAESVIGAPISEAADFLLSQGWRANDGEWHKANHTLRLVVENEVVVNAQIVK